MSDRPLFRNRYRIRGKLGSGAFATVYLAHDTRMDRPVAIKVVDDAGEPDGRAFREAQAAAKLNHPHIVTVHEVVREEGRTCLFTEYVEGQTLRRLFSRGRLTDGRILQAGVQLCRALEHAKRRGVVHRAVSYTHLRAHETKANLVCRLLLATRLRRISYAVFCLTQNKSKSSMTSSD